VVPYNKNKKWRLSRHVEIDSTWCDDRHFLIGSTSVAGDRHQNGKHWGGQLSSCQKSLFLFAVCLFVCPFESFKNLGLAPEKKWRETLGRTP
jgi:hypothetical protein